MPERINHFQIAPDLAPADLLALEETLLLALNEPAGRIAPDAGGFLFFHPTPAPAVVLGTGQKHAEVLDRAACERDGVPILRRASGGGCVMHLPGVLWFSLGVPFTWLPQGAQGGIRATFADVLEPVCATLREDWHLAASLRGICDIALADAVPPRKVAGSAQCRKQRAVLVHGTLLLAADLAPLERYLPLPEKQPDYRAQRTHRDFLTTLREHAPTLDGSALCGALAEKWRHMLAPQVAQTTGGHSAADGPPAGGANPGDGSAAAGLGLEIREVAVPADLA
ncbi:MAG: lipoate--protein ligase family protein, partial [Planctomycetota bacterium]